MRDAVKVVIDGYTGQVTAYKFSDEPIVSTLADIYPTMFTDASEMPASIRSQLQYPTQLYHLQFDDLYIYYQMRDVMTFFNMEDMWDDADDVLGAILDEGNAIRFSNEPLQVLIETGGSSVIPEASEKVQFAQQMVFTPQSALNLRAIPIVLQDGDDYGKKYCLQVPKGHYYLGPEQADSSIDQDPEISSQFTLWNRMGLEVIRGHTSTLLVGREVIYLEPIFLRSLQNPLPQLKEVIVVFRGQPAMAPTLEGALRKALAAHAASDG